MMKLIKAYNLKGNVDRLLERQEFPAITIYLNTYKRWERNEKSKIMLKNQLSQVTSRLIKRGYRQSDLEDLLLPITKISKNINFWKNLTSGTAFFISKDISRAIKLTKSVPSKSFIDDYFNLKYLTEYLFEREKYYILAVSPKKNFLYKAENKQINLLPESDLLPKDMDSTTWMKEGEKSIQHHATKPISKGSRGGMSFHGHGAYKKGKNLLLEHYLEKLDRSINEIIEDYTTPLVLVCTETIYSVYKKINSYPTLLNDYVSGNPDDKNERNGLLKKVWPIVKKGLKNDKRLLLKEYRDNYKNRLTDLTEIVRAAYYGSLDKLFVGTRKEFWGRYNMDNGTIRTDRRRRTDSQDLVNLAVLFTIKNGGEVYKIPEKSLSSREKVGAILRY